MIDERKLRDMLERRARTISATPTDAPKAVRLAHRRLLRNGVVGAFAGVVVVLGAFAGVKTIQTAPTPADRPTPSVRPTSLSVVQRRDGEALVFSGEHLADAANKVVAADPATGETRVLVDAEELGGSLDSAAWSADGRWVAFEVFGCAPDVLNAGVWVTGGPGQARQVTSRPCTGPDDDMGGADFWSWSPTSARLVVVAHDSAGGGTSLVVYDAITGARTDLGSPSGFNDITGLTWSPDGTKVVYSESQLGSIYAVNVDDGSLSRLAGSVGEVNYLERPPGPSPYGSLSWSPDGSHLLFEASGHSVDSALYLMDPDGSDLRMLVETPAGTGFAWSPDGSSIAYTSYHQEPGHQRFRLWTMSIEDPTPFLAYEQKKTSSTMKGWPVWSPDGRSIAYRIGGNGYVVVNADGTGHARPIDGVVYHSWRGGWYHCECYG